MAGKASLLDLTGFDARPRIAQVHHTRRVPPGLVCLLGCLRLPAPPRWRYVLPVTRPPLTRRGPTTTPSPGAMRPWRTSPSNVPVRARATQIACGHCSWCRGIRVSRVTCDGTVTLGRYAVARTGASPEQDKTAGPDGEADPVIRGHEVRYPATVDARDKGSIRSEHAGPHLWCVGTRTGGATRPPQCAHSPCRVETPASPASGPRPSGLTFLPSSAYSTPSARRHAGSWHPLSPAAQLPARDTPVHRTTCRALPRRAPPCDRELRSAALGDGGRDSFEGQAARSPTTSSPGPVGKLKGHSGRSRSPGPNPRTPGGFRERSSAADAPRCTDDDPRAGPDQPAARPSSSRLPQSRRALHAAIGVGNGRPQLVRALPIHGRRLSHERTVEAAPRSPVSRRWISCRWDQNPHPEDSVSSISASNSSP